VNNSIRKEISFKLNEINELINNSLNDPKGIHKPNDAELTYLIVASGYLEVLLNKIENGKDLSETEYEHIKSMLSKF
jgi:hypothetical protein